MSAMAHLSPARSFIFIAANRRLLKTSRRPLTLSLRTSVTHIMTTPVWHCSSLNCAPRHCRRLRARVKSLGNQSSTLSCRSPEFSAGWVWCQFRPFFLSCAHGSGFFAGCHVLALDLVRSWSFDRPSTQTERSNTVGHFELPILTPSPTTPRRALFVLEPAMRRRSSIMIDVDIPSEPPTRKASPERGPNVPVPIARDTIPEEGDWFARKAGLGSLMKTAKQDVKVPEFNMDAFF
jgi:hypothetical protein